MFGAVPTLAELLTPRTRQQWRDLLLNELRDAGFAVGLAPSGDNRRNVVEFFAAGLAKVDEVVGKVAAGAFLETALGDWLDLRARSGFDVEPKAATLTVGTVRLTCAATAGPYVITPGQVWVGRAAAGATPARRYQNTTGGTLPSGGTLSVQVSAEAPGSAYNLGNGQINQVFSGLPGVSVTNLGIWITTPGTDKEAPEPLRQRARSRWGTQGRGANDDAYFYLATTASAEVTRGRVTTNPGDGTLVLYLAGPSGGVSAGAVSAVQRDIDKARPLTDRPNARSATNTPVVVQGTVYVRAAQLAAVQLAVERERLAMQAELDIGAPVDLAELHAVLRRPRDANGLVVPGVTDVDLTSPTGDTTIASTAVAVLDFSALAWVSVP